MAEKRPADTEVANDTFFTSSETDAADMDSLFDESEFAEEDTHTADKDSLFDGSDVEEETHGDEQHTQADTAAALPGPHPTSSTATVTPVTQDTTTSVNTEAETTVAAPSSAPIIQPTHFINHRGERVAFDKPFFVLSSSTVTNTPATHASSTEVGTQKEKA